MKKENNNNRCELLTCLTDNASNPRMLWQMVSSSALAKDIFDTWPRGRLLSAMRTLPPDVCRVAADYVFVTCTGDLRQSARTDLEDHGSLLPEVTLEPLRVLKCLASIDDAIETLTTSDVWKPSNNPGISVKSMNRLIQTYLWRFAVLWAIDKAIKSDPREDRGIYRMEKYRVYLGKLSPKDLRNMARVYDDLSNMIQQAYPEDFAKAFETAYHQHTKLNKKKNARRWKLLKVDEQWHEQQIMLDTEARIDCFIDEQMARGLPFLCSIHTRMMTGLSPPPTIRMLGHYFQPAYCHHMQLQWGYASTSYQTTTGANTARHKSAYLLTPTNTKDAYKVSLLFGLRPGYLSQRHICVDKEIHNLENDDGTLHSGEKRWNKCMEELNWPDLKDSSLKIKE